VATAQRKDAVTAVASEHAPGHDVVNELMVSDPGNTGAAPTEETLR